MTRYIVRVWGYITEWTNEAGEFHREDGPAIEYSNGHKQWWVHGKLHRLDGPAVELSGGDKNWYFNGKRHREDGPAVECSDGHKNWYVDGKLHRLDGPAVEWSSGHKEWWVEGERLSESEFNLRTKQTSCEGKIVEVDGVKYKLTKLK